jgi:hypothetical protein
MCIQQICDLLPKSSFTNSYSPVIFSLPHDLQSFGMDNVDVANNIRPIVVAYFQFNAGIRTMASQPAKQELFTIVLKELGQTDMAHGNKFRI